MAQFDMRTVPTTDLDIPYLRSLCSPIFDAASSECPLIAWAGIFGSVSRGAQRSDSDVDIIVGYSREADYFADVCGSIELLSRRLPEVLGRSVDLVPFVDATRAIAYVHLEALLTARTIWGDPSWPKASEKAAERLLRQEYSRIRKASDIMSNLQKLTLIQTESAVAEREALQLSILSNALSIIDLLKHPGDPFYAQLQRMIPDLFAMEETIRACVEERKPIPEGTMEVLSDRMNATALRAMIQSAELTFQRAALLP